MQHAILPMSDDPFALESEVRYYCRHMPQVFARAVGSEVWAKDGSRYIDLLAACGSLNYGHNNPAIKSRLMEYLASDGIATAMDLHTEAKLDFLRELRDTILRPRGLSYAVQFTGPTGTNAVEAALKLARKVTQRQTVVAFTNGFHGMTLGALAATGSASARRAAGVPLGHVHRLPFDAYAGDGSSALRHFEGLVGDPSSGIEPPAAFLVETVQGEGGLNVASVAWLRRLSATAERMGALLIVDDIQAGCGRTGTFFSFERAGIAPDIVCLSKSIGGIGLPMAIVLLKPHLDAWNPGEHNGTFRGNNLAFVAATAALEFWRTDHFAQTIDRKAAAIATWIRRICETYPTASLSPRGIGLMQGVAFGAPEQARQVAERAFQAGVLIETCGPRGEVLKLMPALTIDDEILSDALDRLHSAIAATLKPAALRNAA